MSNSLKRLSIRIKDEEFVSLKRCVQHTIAELSTSTIDCSDSNTVIQIEREIFLLNAILNKINNAWENK